MLDVITPFTVCYLRLILFNTLLILIKNHNW
jgi:hypothetical protein